MYQQQWQRYMSDVVAETYPENITTRGDDWMSRCEFAAGTRHRVIRDDVEDDVHIRQVRVSSEVDVTDCQTSNGT